MLVDCLTLWVTNLMMEERDMAARIRRSRGVAIVTAPGRLVFVSNEVGLGIVPENQHGARIPRSRRAGCTSRWRSSPPKSILSRQACR